MDEKRGQGGAEYVLLFGAVIFIAIVALIIYKAYFIPINGTDVSLEITNPGSSSLNVMYEVRSTYYPDRIAGSSGKTKYLVPDGKEQTSYTTLKAGQTINVSVPGGLQQGDVIYVEVGVKQSGKSVLVTLTQGDKANSWTVSGPYSPYGGKNAASYTKSGSVIKTITITETNTGLKTSSDIATVREQLG